MSTISKSYQRYLLFLKSHPRLVWAALSIYLAGLVAAMIFLNISITPDRLALALFIAALLLGKGVVFVRDWLPFLVLLMAYEGLRGFADYLPSVHIADIIWAERTLFGGVIPTIWLQQHLYTPSVNWIDIFATAFYFLHFPLPLFLAFWLWLTRKEEYWRFVTNLLTLCFAGFVTFLVFPAMPPWLAAKEGYLPPVHKVIDQVLGLFPSSMSVSYFYHSLNPNQVAAMPSLHAAWPWLVFLTLYRIKGRWALLFLPYCLGLWFSIVYLGEHYVVDAIAGIGYATAAYWLGPIILIRLRSSWKKLVELVSRPEPETSAETEPEL